MNLNQKITDYNHIWLDITKKYEEGEGKRYIEGYAAMYGADRNRPIVEITEEAMDSAETDLEKNSTVFLEHKHDEAIGKIEESKVDSSGLWVKCLISQTKDDIWTMIEEGILNSFSVGFRVLSYEEEYDEEIKEIVIKVKQAEFYEVSVVGLPANPNTKIVSFYIQKSFQEGGNKKMFKIVCKSCGYNAELDEITASVDCPECGEILIEKNADLEVEATESTEEVDEVVEETESEEIEESVEETEEVEETETEEESEEEVESTEDEVEEVEEESEEVSETEEEVEEVEEVEETVEEVSEETSEEVSEDVVEETEIVEKDYDAKIDELKSLLIEVKDNLVNKDVIKQMIVDALADMAPEVDTRKSRIAVDETAEAIDAFKSLDIRERMRLKLEHQMEVGEE